MFAMQPVPSKKSILPYIVYCACVAVLGVFIASCNNNSGPAIPQDFTRKVIDTNPPVTPLSPEESIKKIQLPPGFHVEVVANEPMIQEPVAIAWDGNGRMYVAEMNTYMKTANADGEFEPTSRIELMEDTDGDGKMDKSSTFADSLLLP